MFYNYINMAKKLRIMAWNVQDNLNNPAVHKRVIVTSPDIAVLPEAVPQKTGLSAETRLAFYDAGYTVISHPYNDEDGRPDYHSLVVIAKQELVRGAEYKTVFVGRTALQIVMDNGLTFTGVHLDDRSESSRFTQAHKLIHEVIRKPADGTQDIIAGDFNSMHPNHGWAPMLRSARGISKLLPSKEPTDPYMSNMNRLERFGSLSQRLSQMALGKTIELFEKEGFKETSLDYRPTIAKWPIGVQIDHILYRGEGIEVVAPTLVEPHKGLSDHCSIRADLSIS